MVTLPQSPRSQVILMADTRQIVRQVDILRELIGRRYGVTIRELAEGVGTVMVDAVIAFRSEAFCGEPAPFRDEEAVILQTADALARGA